MVQYRSPLIIKFTTNGDKSIKQMDARTVNVDASAPWKPYKETITNALNATVNGEKAFDYVMVSFDEGFKESNKEDFHSTNIKLNALFSDAKKKDIKVFNRYDNQLYLLNPDYKEKGSVYTPSDDTILAKYNAVGDDYEWQHQQAEVWKKFSHLRPLGGPDDKFVSDHKSMLANPSRGLKDEDLDGFFSWQTGKPVIPGLMDNNMVGFPNMKAQQFNDIELFVGDKPIPSKPIALKTGGNAGYVIPMRNVNGEYAKFQVGTDITPINVFLKAKAPDGVSIQKSQYYDKNNKEFYGGKYLFKLTDGRDSDLHVKSASNDKIFFEDVYGEFEVKLKSDIKQTLIERGYDMSEIIDKLQVSPQAKYIWPAGGDLTGTKECREIVSPSNAGFVKAREPKNGSDQYVVMVAEGALKGIITAKYLDVKDSTGVSLADKIAGDRGLIVAQVPGVAEAFVKSVSHIYTDTDLKIAGTYIAMDADGRENLSVARGIHSAYNELAKYNPVSVLSWDPEQKGIDDALLAVSRGDITVADMKVKWGSADKLFPLDQAEAPNPYKLDGTRANGGQYGTPDWLIEYRADLARKEAIVRENQLATNDPNYEDNKLAEAMGSVNTESIEQSFASELEAITTMHEANVKALVDKYADTIDVSKFGLEI